MNIIVTVWAIGKLGDDFKYEEYEIIEEFNEIVKTVSKLKSRCRKDIKNIDGIPFTGRFEVEVIIDENEVFGSFDYKTKEKQRLEKLLSTLEEDKPHLFV